MNQANLKLKEEYLKRRKRNPDFSLRSFAKWLQVSPAQLSQILSGKRPLTQKTAARLSDRLGFSPKEKLEFLSFSSPQISAELMQVKKTVKLMNVEEEKFRVISDWYHFAILSLTRLPGAKGDPRWIAKKLKISPSQANEALTRLQGLGILSAPPRFEQIGDPIRVITNIPSKAVQKYHHQNLNLAMDKLERVCMEKREFQSITMAINPEKLVWFRNRLAQFLTEVSEELENSKQRDVYTLAVQLFPVSETENKEPK